MRSDKNLTFLLITGWHHPGEIGLDEQMIKDMHDEWLLLPPDGKYPNPSLWLSIRLWEIGAGRDT